MILVQGGTASSQNVMLSSGIETLSHEEADTSIPLHVLDVLKEGRIKTIDVHCADMNILVMLMDLVANNQRISTEKSISIVKTGNVRRKKPTLRKKLISSIMLAVLDMNRRIGFHNFTGADWGSKLVGISKEC